MKKLAILGMAALVLVMGLAVAAPAMAKSTTVNVWWLEDAERYGGDGTLLDQWQNDRIPPADPVGYIEFTKTGKAYHAGMEWFYNYYPLENFTASPLVTSNGKFAAWARYTSPYSGLAILDKIRGRLTIDDEVGTAHGSYVQYSYAEGITDEATVMSWYPNAVPTDDPDVWLLGITYYTVHGQVETP
jgi:hypothetical protein